MARGKGLTFKDHFSGHASAYAQARPTYAAALFDWLAAHVPRHDLAWDAGCGNGQASVALAAHFAAVFASDPSATQIAAAVPHPQVRYAVEPAEACSLPDASIDLVTVAQALHWFDHPRFFAEVRRVLRPGGLFAAWCYERSSVNPTVDAVFDALYHGELAPYWPPERRHIHAGYATIEVPFAPVPAPAMSLQVAWTFAQYLGYLRSWSAAQRFLAATGRDLVGEFAPALAQAWGDPAQVRAVTWPMTIKAGRV